MPTAGGVKMPSVSIIITALNEERYIVRAIKSAIDQTYPDVEIIVVDDGSTDQTLALIKTFGAKVSIIHNERPTGLMSARNAGVAKATGDYITFLDGDDEFDLDKVATQVTLLSHLRTNSLLFTGRVVFSEMGIPSIPQLHDLSGKIKTFDYNDVLQKRITSLGATFMMKRDDYNKIGRMDPEVGKERDFFARFSFSGGALYRLYLPLYIQHRKAGSMSSQVSETYQRELKMLRAWDPAHQRDVNRHITGEEFKAYENKVAVNYQKQFAGTDQATINSNHYLLQKIERSTQQLTKKSKKLTKDFLGFIIYLVYKLKDKPPITYK